MVLGMIFSALGAATFNATNTVAEQASNATSMTSVSGTIDVQDSGVEVNDNEMFVFIISVISLNLFVICPACCYFLTYLYSDQCFLDCTNMNTVTPTSEHRHHEATIVRLVPYTDPEFGTQSRPLLTSKCNMRSETQLQPIGARDEPQPPMPQQHLVHHTILPTTAPHTTVLGTPSNYGTNGSNTDASRYTNPGRGGVTGLFSADQAFRTAGMGAMPPSPQPSIDSNTMVLV